MPEARHEITWNVLMLSHLDSCTNQCELEVQRIIHLQGIANQLPDVFINNKKIVKSHILVANTLVRIEVLVGQSVNIATNKSKPHLKRGRLVGVKDKIIDLVATYEQKSLENKPHEELSPEEDQVPENNEISIHYVHTGEI